MAAVLRLVQDGGGTVNLLATTGAGVCIQSWAPKIATPVSGGVPLPVTEAMTVRVQGTSHDNLAAQLQGLHDMQKYADEYINDSAATAGVWLYAQLANETNQRRALVRRIDAKYSAEWHGMLAQPGNTLTVALAVEREPYWEGIAATVGGNGTPTAAAAVMFDYTTNGGSDITGDVGARIADIAIAGTPSMAIGRLWVGLRSANKHGTVSTFVPVWECEVAGATLGTDAVRATDNSASPGGTANTKVTVTPGTTGWANRLRIELGDTALGNISEQFGRYLWLLRHKVSSGTWELQLRHGYYSMPDANLVQGPIVQSTATAWDYAEMGIASMPFAPSYCAGGTARGDELKSTIFVFARRTAGTGNLDLDCLCPIPVDEGYLKVGPYNNINNIPQNPSWMYRFQSPREVSLYAGPADFAPWETPAYSEQDFALPPGDGRMIIAYAQAGTSTLTDTIRIENLQYYPRWSSLRGNE